MDRKRAITPVVVFLVLTQTTCKTTFEPDELTIEGLCEILNDSICSYLQSCCTTEEYEQVILAGPMALDVNCNDVQSSGWYQGCVANMELSVDRGTVDLTDAAMPSCESGLADLVSRCPNFTPFVVQFYSVLGTICADVITGTVDSGEECYTSYDCVYGYCDPVSSTCMSWVALGDPCTQNGQCALPYSCIQGACAPLSAGNGDAGGPCDPDDHTDCEQNAYCSGTTCMSLKSAGEPCGEDVECLGMCDRTTTPDSPVCADLCNGI